MLNVPNKSPQPRDADAEHELEESTAEVDRFVNDQAVVRIRFGGDGGDAEERGGAKEDGAQEGETGTVPRLDEDHLRKVLEKVTHALLSWPDEKRKVTASPSAPLVSAVDTNPGWVKVSRGPPSNNSSLERCTCAGQDAG